MKSLQRGIRVLTLIALLFAGISLMAQEATEEPEPEATESVSVEATEEPGEDTSAESESSAEVDTGNIVVTGSGVVNPVLEAAINASGTELAVDILTTGSDAGFEQFCTGQSQVTTAIRAISVSEDADCTSANIEYAELVIGYAIPVLVSNPADEFLTCLSAPALDAVFAPSATSTNWSEIELDGTDASTSAPPAEATPEVTEEPVSLPDIRVYVPENATVIYEAFEEFVSGFGFRSDATSADPQAVLAAVASTPGTIGVVPFEVARSQTDRVNIVNIASANAPANCVEPTVSNVETDVYPAFVELFVYVNRNNQPAFAEVLDYLTSSEAGQTLNEAGYSAVSEGTAELNRAILDGEASARALTAEEVTYDIPPNLSGTITIVGATSGFPIANGNATRFTSTQQSLVINTELNGQEAGIEAFCNGDADIIFTDGATEAVCEGNVETEHYDFGQQAAVLLSNAGDGFATCLTLEQVNTIWNATSTDTVSNWNDVSDAFPDQSLVLVGLPAGTTSTDILMSATSQGPIAPVRLDVAETNPDPLYRAAAVANVSGSMTYMSWPDYQRVVANEQGNIQLVAIDSGEGCVVPSIQAFNDGTYALTRGSRMFVKQSSLAQVNVQSFIWTMFTDGNFTIIDRLNYVGGISSESLPALRTDLLVQFEEALQAAQTAPEATPEATEEASDS